MPGHAARGALCAEGRFVCSVLLLSQLSTKSSPGPSSRRSRLGRQPGPRSVRDSGALCAPGGGQVPAGRRSVPRPLCSLAEPEQGRAAAANDVASALKGGRHSDGRRLPGTRGGGPPDGAESDTNAFVPRCPLGRRRSVLRTNMKGERNASQSSSGAKQIILNQQIITSPQCSQPVVLGARGRGAGWGVWGAGKTRGRLGAGWAHVPALRSTANWAKLGVFLRILPHLSSIESTVCHEVWGKLMEKKNQVDSVENVGSSCNYKNTEEKCL